MIKITMKRSLITLSSALLLVSSSAFSQGGVKHDHDHSSHGHGSHDHGSSEKHDSASSQEDHGSEKTITNAIAQCGIGALFFPKSESAAIVSNVIWDFGTTAYSSQTSSPGSCNGAQVTAAHFIQETYPVLEEQFVKGGGEHVTALMNILDCGAASHSQVISLVQDDLSASLQSNGFSSASQLEKTKQLGASLDRAITACNA